MCFKKYVKRRLWRRTIQLGDNMGMKKSGRCEICKMRTTVERKRKFGYLMWLCSNCKK